MLTLNLDWASILVPQKPLLEIIVRGTLIYLGLFILLRLMLKRQSSGLSMTDILLVVLLADAAQNGMADDYRSVPEGLLLVATLVFWSYALDWLEFYWPAFGRLITPAPLPLIRKGVMQRQAMRSELVSVEELRSAMRKAGIESLSDVKEAFMEPDGHITMIRWESEEREND